MTTLNFFNYLISPNYVIVKYTILRMSQWCISSQLALLFQSIFIIKCNVCPGRAQAKASIRAIIIFFRLPEICPLARMLDWLGITRPWCLGQPWIISRHDALFCSSHVNPALAIPQPPSIFFIKTCNSFFFFFLIYHRIDGRLPSMPKTPQGYRKWY